MGKNMNIILLKNNTTMKNILRFLAITVCCMLIVNTSFPEEVQTVNKSTSTLKETAAGCAS